MRVLITGGCGFIGRHLVAMFEERGDKVSVVDNLSTSSGQGLPAEVDLLVGDMTDPGIPETIHSLGPDVIVHAAAQASVPRSMAEPELDWRVNVEGTARVIAGAKRVPGCRIVFLSTGGAIYGETPVPASEVATVPQPKSDYGAHKYLAEKYLELSGVSYGIARLANVYGPGQRSDLEGGVAAIFAERLVARQPITIYGDGEQSRDFVHVWDVAEAVAAIAGASVNGLWNVGSGTETTVNTLLARMEELFGGALLTSYEPARIGDVRKSMLAIDRIEQELGWSPRVDLAAGIESLKPRTIHDQLR
jgi:UDP-glucose 4-epimerase